MGLKISLTLRLVLVEVPTSDSITVSSSVKATLEVTRLVGKGALDVRPSMFNEVETGAVEPWLFKMADADAVCTAEVDCMARELSGTLEGVTWEDADPDAVFWGAVGVPFALDGVTFEDVVPDTEFWSAVGVPSALPVGSL